MALSKLCVVAGVGPGIGLAVARRFAKDGYAIALIARRAEALAAHAADIAALGVSVRAYPADLGDADAVAAIFARIEADMGAPEVLVYNAALWRAAETMTLDPALFTADLALDVTGALASAQAVYPAMKAAGRGTMLFTGGGLALRPEYGKGVASLTAGKAALRALVHAFAGEVAGDGIHVATVTVAGMVAPGGPFDPDRIAQAYAGLHAEAPGAWRVEHVFGG